MITHVHLVAVEGYILTLSYHWSEIYGRPIRDRSPLSDVHAQIQGISFTYLMYWSWLFINVLFECLVNRQGAELSNCRANSFQIDTVDGASHCLSIETREELLQLEKAWYKATYSAVKHLGVRLSEMCRPLVASLDVLFNELISTT